MRIKYNSPSKRSLSKLQERYVRLYHKRKVVKQMAEHLGVPTTRIYSFLYLEKFIKTQSARRGGHSKTRQGFFNTSDHSNWIV
jgi:hypothetical protein